MLRSHDIEAFILAQPMTMTYSEIEKAVHERFGADCGWTRLHIMALWLDNITVRKGTFSAFDRDPEVREFVNDRLFRVSLDELRALCLATFGAERAPSRSALHRHSQRIRRDKVSP